MTGTAEPKVNIALTFDFDGYTPWVTSRSANSPTRNSRGNFGIIAIRRILSRLRGNSRSAYSLSMISRGEFAPIGVRRILALLGEYKVQATFFTPGCTALSYPRVVTAIQDAGHEIGHHGWMHEKPVNLNRDDELRILERGIDAIKKVTGNRPAGYRSPEWNISPNTVELLLEHDFEYESSLMGSDYEPYWCRVGDKWSKTEPFIFGEPTKLVEMPVAWHMDDFPYFEFIPGMEGQGLRPPSTVLEIWKGEFDYLYHQVGHGVLIVTMHPQVIGRGHRLQMLTEFLEYTSAHSGVRFTTCINYVREWRVGRKPELPSDVG